MIRMSAPTTNTPAAAATAAPLPKTEALACISTLARSTWSLTSAWVLAVTPWIACAIAASLEVGGGRGGGTGLVGSEATEGPQDLGEHEAAGDGGADEDLRARLGDRALRLDRRDGRRGSAGGGSGLTGSVLMRRARAGPRRTCASRSGSRRGWR